MSAVWHDRGHMWELNTARSGQCKGVLRRYAIMQCAESVLADLFSGELVTPSIPTGLSSGHAHSTGTVFMDHQRLWQWVNRGPGLVPAYTMDVAPAGITVNRSRGYLTARKAAH